MKILLLSFCILTLFVLTLQRPVDCKDQPQTVLEVLQKEDCKDLSICLSNCGEFLPNCPSRFDVLLEDGSKVGKFFKGIEFEIPRNKTPYSEEAFKKTCVDKDFSTISKAMIQEFRDNVEKYMKILGIKSKRVLKLLKIISWVWRSYGLPLNSKNFDLKKFLQKEFKNSIARYGANYHFILKIKNQFTEDEKRDYEILYNTVLDDLTDKLRDLGKYQSISDPLRRFFHLFIQRIENGKSDSIKEEYFGVEIYDIIDHWIETFNKFQKICDKNDSRDVRWKKLKDFDDNMSTGDVPYIFGKNSTFNKQRDGKSQDFIKIMEFRDTIYHRITSKFVERTKLCMCYSFEAYYKWKSQQLIDQGLDTSAISFEREDLMKVIKNRCKIECKRRQIIIKRYEEKNRKTKELFNNPLIPINETRKIIQSQKRFH